ncbi:MAG TPA: hypothetical protein VGN71_07060, partial [Solirubrobacteraceae bacterium]|nr:hypothetical protein [Solirubrobacteraceae bacterium]
LHPREASMFACIADTVVAPGGALSPLGRTDAVAAFGSCLAAAPASNRALLRALLYAVEVAPLALGYGTRMRRLSPDARTEALERLEAGPAGGALRPLTALAKLSYYGDDGVSRTLGYDPDAVVARGRALREAEVRW